MFGDGKNLTGGEGVQPQSREALLYCAKQAAKPGDCVRGSDFPVEHRARSAHGDDVCDLVADVLKVRAIRGVFIVDSSVDCVTYDAFRMQSPAHRIGFHPNPNQIIALEAVQSLFPADSHASILRSL